MNTNRIILIAIVFLILVGAGYFLLQDYLPKSNQFTLTINNCQVQTDKDLTMKEGDEITLLVTSDQDAQFHIHGYDLLRELTANQEEKIVFQASDPGRYDFELENHCELGQITVTNGQGNVPETENDDPAHHEGETEEASRSSDHEDDDH